MDREFIEAQIEEMRKYKWIESERAGRDLGDAACVEWVRKYAADFRDEWNKKHRKE